MKNTLFFFLALLFGNCNNHCPDPDRPLSLPKNAVWKGGCDGGYWISIEGISRIRIFNEYTGELEMDANYFAEDNCKILLKPEFIVAVSSEIIYLKSDKIYCNYRIKLPAFGGEIWEVMKTKKKL